LRDGRREKNGTDRPAAAGGGRAGKGRGAPASLPVRWENVGGEGGGGVGGGGGGGGGLLTDAEELDCAHGEGEEALLLHYGLRKEAMPTSLQ